jgi:dienelactone hydrolase
LRNISDLNSLARIRPRSFLLLIAALLPLARSARAEDLVSFASAAAGMPAVRGYLSKPAGDGPFAALVLAHNCLGPPANRREVGAAFATLGYVALLVDNFATRGLEQTCEVAFDAAVGDAFGALKYLSAQPYVDGRRIAVVGYSQGGDAALTIATAPGAFKAAAAYYPPCANRDAAQLKIPTLVLIGGRDDVTPAADCAHLKQAQRGDAMTLIVYPDARHGFDAPEYSGDRPILGMMLKYDRPAAARAFAALQAFLKRNLSR